MKIRIGIHPTTRGAFTLLEIILALAILAGCLAALGEVMRSSDRNATLVRDETQAQLLAASVMAELEAGMRDLVVVENETLEQSTDPPWACSIHLDPTDHEELLLVRVQVTQQLPPEQDPAHFEMVRWMLQPSFFTAEREEVVEE